MYTLIANLLSIPDNYASSTITYVAGSVAIILLVVFIDLIYRLIRAICTRGKFD